MITFPKGAASIHVNQRGHKNQMHDGNYLALVNSAGRYLLNGGLTLSTVQKDIEVNGKFNRFYFCELTVFIAKYW